MRLEGWLTEVLNITLAPLATTLRYSNESIPGCGLAKAFDAGKDGSVRMMSNVCQVSDITKAEMAC